MSRGVAAYLVGLLAIIGVLSIVGGIVLYCLPTPPKPAPIAPAEQKTYQYNLLYNGAVTHWEGEEIRTRGLCVEIILNDRVDTIVCPAFVISEAADPTVKPTSAPASPTMATPNPESQHTPGPGAITGG